MRTERERQQVTLAALAEVTRIPLRSLQLLEAGEFEALPGDVFVRGFITAYANCLHLDTQDVVTRYKRCKLDLGPQSLQIATSIDDAAPLPPALTPEQSQVRKRVGVTFALILLLIVATLTISYFLRPTESSGDGVTMTTIRR